LCACGPNYTAVPSPHPASRPPRCFSLAPICLRHRVTASRVRIHVQHRPHTTLPHNLSSLLSPSQPVRAEPNCPRPVPGFLLRVFLFSASSGLLFRGLLIVWFALSRTPRQFGTADVVPTVRCRSSRCPRPHAHRSGAMCSHLPPPLAPYRAPRQSYDACDANPLLCLIKGHTGRRVATRAPDGECNHVPSNRRLSSFFLLSLSTPHGLERGRFVRVCSVPHVR